MYSAGVCPVKATGTWWRDKRIHAHEHIKGKIGYCT